MYWQNVSIINRQGSGLSGLLRTAAPVKKGDIPDNLDHPTGQLDLLPPLLIVCHGFTGTKEGGGGATAMANKLGPLGFDTLLFDFSGCGESEGVWEEVTLSRQVDDLGAVVDWASSKGYRQIVLNGRSFGGTTVLAYAPFDRKIAAVCTWAAVARPLELFHRLLEKEINLKAPPGARIKLAGKTGSVYLRNRFFQDLQDYNLAECAAEITPRPFLIFHGTADQVVPISDARLLFDSACEPKDLAIIKGADHSFSEHLGQVWDRFFNWLGALR